MKKNEVKKIDIILNSESDTIQLGKFLGNTAKPGAVVFLQGELGSGKTTFVRGFLRGMGFHGKVKSPTFTLVEEYDLEMGTLYHFDLYRIDKASALSDMGIREYFSPETIVILEWPEYGEGYLPRADLLLEFKYLDHGRDLLLQANTSFGKAWIQAVDAKREI